MASAMSTFANHLIEVEIGIEDIEEDLRFERGIQDMINEFFCDILLQEDVGVNEEEKTRK